MTRGEGKPIAVRDERAGYHRFRNHRGEPYGSFEIWWSHGPNDPDASGNIVPGWYWWACFPNCTPDSDAFGPFKTSYFAWLDARRDS